MFEVGTVEDLNRIDQLELWIEGKGLGHGWLAEYIEITNNQTGEVVCFVVGQYLNDKNGGVEGNPLTLRRTTGDQSCREPTEDELENRFSARKTLPTSTLQSSFSVITRTGLAEINEHVRSAVFIRLRDARGNISEAIQLQNSTSHNHPFGKHQTGETREARTRSSPIRSSQIISTWERASCSRVFRVLNSGMTEARTRNGRLNVYKCSTIKATLLTVSPFNLCSIGTSVFTKNPSCCKDR